MLVELDKVKKIIRKCYIYTTKESLLGQILYDLNKLAYDTTYQCLNCNKDIYYDKNNNVYKHVDNNNEWCNINNCWLKSLIMYNNCAIPKPDDNLAKQGCKSKYEDNTCIEDL